MITVAKFLYLSSLYILFAGLFLLLVRVIMEQLGSSKIIIYKLWHLFLLGFMLLLSFHLYSPDLKIIESFSQTFELPILYASQKINTSFFREVTLVVFWALTSLILLTSLIIKYLVLKKSLLLNSIKTDNAIETPFVITPIAFGISKPKVFLPLDYQKSYTLSQQQLLIDHEQVHCKRYDPLILILFRMIMRVFWFHPMIYLLNYYMKKDQEVSCDEIVLSKTNLSSEYSKLLLQLNRQVTISIKNPELFCSSTTMLKERIMLIKNLKPKSFTNNLISKSLVLASAVGLITTTTVLSEMVQLSEKEQAFFVVPKPPKPQSPPSLNDTKHVGLLVPKPKAPDSPVLPSKADASDINKIKAISTPAPFYPRAAATDNISGYVVIEFDINNDGSVQNLQVIKSDPLEIFDKEALRSVAKYKFEPVTEKIRLRQKVVFSANKPLI